VTDLTSWVPEGIDLSKPSAARAYDAFLGGSHNFRVDREFARRAEQVFPGVAKACQANRSFLRRTVEFMVASGVRQFLDIGSGIPTVGNVHEVAQKIDPGCRVVYVDNERVAVAHSELILEGNELATVVEADMREPESILDAERTRELIDFDQPVGLLMLALLHFLPDSDDPVGLVARYREALAPGSHLVVSHATAESRPEEMRALESLYATSANPAVARSSAWITGLFGDFRLVDPGAVFVPEWRPDGQGVVAHPEHYIFFGGVAAKP
jgi:SAM-dependent methyltransferase